MPTIPVRTTRNSAALEGQRYRDAAPEWRVLQGNATLASAGVAYRGRRVGPNSMFRLSAAVTTTYQPFFDAVGLAADTPVIAFPNLERADTPEITET